MPNNTVENNNTTHENSNYTLTRALLQKLNDEKALYFIPVMIWVALLMFVGVIGNSLVVYVYRRRFKKTSSNYFILTMAVFDLVACVVGMPTEIYDLRYSYTFYSSVGCKIFRFTETFTIYGSAIILVEIAIDRYLKICRPLLVISLFKIKLSCFLAAALALCFSSPTAFLFGITRTTTPIEGLLGYDCSIEEQYRKTTFQRVYYGTLTVVFVVTLLVLTALYVRIWVEIKRRRNFVIGDQISSRSTEASYKQGCIKINVKQKPDNAADHCEDHDDDSSGSGSTRKNNYFIKPSEQQPRSRFGGLANYTLKIQITKTTIVLFAVTVAFIISYLPAIVIMMVRSVIVDFEKNRSIGVEVVSKFFSKFFFINNAINPIIYSFLNVNFRLQTKKTVRKVFCCERRTSPKKGDSDRSTKREMLMMATAEKEN